MRVLLEHEKGGKDVSVDCPEGRSCFTVLLHCLKPYGRIRPQLLHTLIHRGIEISSRDLAAMVGDDSRHVLLSTEMGSGSPDDG